MLPNPETCHYISPDELETFDGAVVDVRTPEAYAEAHIPGTANHCVYEVDFLKNFPEAYPDKTRKVLVYGDGGAYKADLAALGRLQFLGYTNVSILEGGLSRWLSDSRPVEGSDSGEAADAGPKHIGLNTERTKVRWVGRNLMNQHNGEITASVGFIKIDTKGVPRAGKVTVDLQQMVCHDITDKGMADMLIGHLASADFFDVEHYPEATFELKSTQPINKATYGLPNYSIQGVLSARGLSVELHIDALIEPIKGGYVFQSAFSFDRTQLGALYGSGRVFERLGMHLVNDLVSMDIIAFFDVSV
ncbi:MAG: YceI family protein [Verrucomicrobiota bacterium]